MRNGIFELLRTPFFARSLTLVPCSLLRDRTETFPTQAILFRTKHCWGEGGGEGGVGDKGMKPCKTVKKLPSGAEPYVTIKRSFSLMWPVAMQMSRNKRKFFKYMRKSFNSNRIGLGHQHGHRFIVLGHQYGGRDSMYKCPLWGSTQKMFIRRGSTPRSNPYPFIYHFSRKRCTFHIPFLELCKNRTFSRPFKDKIHLLALLGPFTDPNDRFPCPFIYFNYPTLSNTWSLKKIPLSGGVSA